MELNDIIDRIKSSEKFESVEAFYDLISKCNLNKFKKYVDYNKNKYNRITLYENKDFEIVLICWLPMQSTKRHYHPKNGCLMKVLKGRLIEKRETEKEIKNLIKGDITFVSKDIEHIISNSYKKSITLHIYAPSGFYSKKI